MNRMRSLTCVALLVALASGAAGAQQPPQPARPGGAGARPQQSIDPLTARIQGRVVAADSGTPIRRAEVRATMDSGISRLATTGDDGRFELRDLPAGRFRVHVLKSGFVPLTYGQRSPLEAPALIDLARGQQFTANIALPRGGAIVGRVYDLAGEPVAGMRVQAFRTRTVEGRRRLIPAGTPDVTDDLGAFRVYGLAPADYYVSASPSRQPQPMPLGAGQPAGRRGPEPALTTFYPGTPNVEEAQRVPLAAGGEARADIQVGAVQAATLAGIVVTSDGTPAADANLVLVSEFLVMSPALASGPPPAMLSAFTMADGSFTFEGVPPGTYSLRVTVSRGGAPSEPGERASQLIHVTGDLDGLTIVTSRGGNAEVRFVADTGVTRPLPTAVTVEPRAADSMDHSSWRFIKNGVHEFLGLTSPVHLDVQGLPEDWAVKAILADGVDITDRPLDVKGTNATVRIVLTDRITRVSGTVQDDARDAVPGERQHYRVVLFADDAARWRYPSRYLRATRTTDDGTFAINGLPGDQQYLAVAVDHLEEGEEADPEFLAQMRDRATRFSLADAEQKTIEVPLLRR